MAQKAFFLASFLATAATSPGVVANEAHAAAPLAGAEAVSAMKELISDVVLQPLKQRLDKQDRVIEEQGRVIEEQGRVIEELRDKNVKLETEMQHLKEEQQPGGQQEVARLSSPTGRGHPRRRASQ